MNNAQLALQYLGMNIKIWDICPFSSKKELGKCHNEFIALIPKDDYVLIRDPDTMYLHPHQRTWIEEIIEKHGDNWDLLGCMTNRVGNYEQVQRQITHTWCSEGGQKIDFHPDTMFEIKDIDTHTLVASALHSYFEQPFPFDKPEYIKETNLIAGFFMLFKRSLWDKIKFEEGIDFDIKFCKAVKKAGGTIGIMQGIYIFHAYRWLSDNPTKYKKHLL